MQELIDRQAALEKMCGDCKSGYDGHCPHPCGMCHEYESILQVPTIRAKTARQGRWVVRGQEIYCSECNEESLYNPFGASKFSDFCPYCGADMRDGGADNDSE